MIDRVIEEGDQPNCRWKWRPRNMRRIAGRARMGDTLFPERFDMVALTPKRGRQEKKDEVGILGADDGALRGCSPKSIP